MTVNRPARAYAAARLLPVSINLRALLAAVDQEFAAKIAAAYMTSPQADIAAIVERLRVEQQQKKSSIRATVKTERRSQRAIRPKNRNRYSANRARLLISLASYVLMADVLFKICYISFLY